MTTTSQQLCWRRKSPRRAVRQKRTSRKIIRESPKRAAAKARAGANRVLARIRSKNLRHRNSSPKTRKISSRHNLVELFCRHRRLLPYLLQRPRSLNGPTASLMNHPRHLDEVAWHVSYRCRPLSPITIQPISVPANPRDNIPRIVSIPTFHRGNIPPTHT